VATSREGVYVCGAFQGPKDIPQSVIEASSAAAQAGSSPEQGRNTLTRAKERFPQRDVPGERPRIGVFVCHCGINIGSVVDVPAVRDYAKTLPYVEYVADNLYSCSQDTQDAMAQVIKANNLNRIVVAACTPKTHEPLFQETLVSAGLNKYLFEMTNIRNQDSWVHKSDPEEATQKAKDLVRMAVAKVALMEPLPEAPLDVNQKALVWEAAYPAWSPPGPLSDQGYKVFLVENPPGARRPGLGIFTEPGKGEDIQKDLAGLIEIGRKGREYRNSPEVGIDQGGRFRGQFQVHVEIAGNEGTVEHGIAVVATGGTSTSPTNTSMARIPGF
jgi:heterodisulfide reductase subunit A2